MAGVTNFFQTAIQTVTQAIEADQAHKYDDAFRLYRLSLEYFYTALKYEKNDRTKQTIRSKVEEYITRAEQLKDMLDKKKKTQESPPLFMADSDIQADINSTEASSSSPAELVELVEPGLAEEFGKIGSALKKNPFYPEGLLAIAFAYAYGLILWARYVEGNVIENPLSSRWASSKVVVSRAVAEKHTDSLLALINALLEVSRDVYYCNFPILAAKFAAISLTLAIFGNLLSGVTLSYIALVFLFAWPRVYEEKKSIIDQYYKLVQDQINTYVNIAISKLPLPKPAVDKRESK